MEFFNSNGPLNGMKRDLTEGGVRVPMIAFWPKQIPANTVTEHLSGFEDVFATIAELTGSPLPDDTTGISFLPTLLGDSKEQQPREFLYWEFKEKGGKEGIVTDRWKAIRRGTIKNPDGPIILFDLKTDISEQNNVAADHPEIAREFAGKITQSHTPLAE